MGNSKWEFRASACRALAEKWPDDATRALLAQRAFQDEDDIPRSAALQALAERWPDEATRALLAQRAVQDDDYVPACRACGRWPRSGRTRRRVPCSPSGPSRMTDDTPQRRA